MIDQFLIDGKSYNVHVLDLQRSFLVKDAINMGQTMNGEIYRDPIGTYYNYSMTVSEKDSDREALDAFWDAISTPDKCHVCVFPYNQETLSQRMYITSGTQKLRRLYKSGIHWDSVTINFTAMSPKVVPK